MAVAFVRATQGNIVNSVLTLNIQVSSGSDRVLVVGLAYRSNNPAAPTSILFNGAESFLVERVGTDAADAQCFLYYLVAPTETTADVVITMPSSAKMVGFVAYFTGVDQIDPFTAESNDAQGNDAAPTIAINSAVDEICVDIMCQVSAGPDTTVAAHTEICNGAAISGGTDCRGAGQYVAGQASRTMNYTMSDTDDWSIVAGALQEPSGVTHYGAATLSGVGTLAAKGVRIFTAAATLSGVGTLTAAGVRIFTGAATLAGSGTLTALGGLLHTAAATLSGVGSLVAAGVKIVVHYGAATLSGVGVLTAKGVRIFTSSATLSGLGTLTAKGRGIFIGKATLAGSGALTVLGGLLHFAAATLSGIGTLTAAGVVLVIRYGAATLSGVGSLTAIGVRIRRGAATLSGIGSLVTLAVATLIGKATLSGVGMVTAIGTVTGGAVIHYGAATLSGVGSLSAREATGAESTSWWACWWP